jgi:hypothetical protein
MRHLDTDAQRIPPFQLKWDQSQLVLSHSGSGWAVEISNGGADVREKLGRVSPDQPEQGTETSSDRAISAGGSQGRWLRAARWPCISSPATSAIGRKSAATSASGSAPTSDIG